MPKKEYVEQYVAVLNTALKGLCDEEKEAAIMAADKEALGEAYDEFEAIVTGIYDAVKDGTPITIKP